MLARQVRFLLRLKENPETSPEAARRLNLQQWQVEKMAKQAARFSTAALRSHLFLLHQTDYHLKTSAGSPRVWLEWCLLQMGPG
jgi:DNA polymerase III delta subunit